MTTPDDPTRPAAPLGEDGATRPGTAAQPGAARDEPARTAPSEDARPTDPTDPTDRPTGRRAAGPVSERPREDTTRPRGETAEQPPVLDEPAGGGKTAGMWIGLILGAIILVLLLIFVIQNNVPAGFRYFGAEFDLPLGVAMLLAAIAGALVMALVGSVRMVQMSWTIRRMRKQQEKIRRATR